MPTTKFASDAPLIFALANPSTIEPLKIHPKKNKKINKSTMIEIRK